MSRELRQAPFALSAALRIIANQVARWSSTWMYDRYIPGSAHVSDRGLRGEVYAIRGSFDFARFGARQTIPFAAAFTKSANGYRFSNLCYNDTTSGMTDCIDPLANLDERGAAAMQSRQALGAIVALGVVAAMSEAFSSDTCVERRTFFGETYFYCY